MAPDDAEADYVEVMSRIGGVGVAGLDEVVDEGAVHPFGLEDVEQLIDVPGLDLLVPDEVRWYHRHAG